jgi:hypothetical protein
MLVIPGVSTGVMPKIVHELGYPVQTTRRALALKLGSSTERQLGTMNGLVGVVMVAVPS